MIPNEKEKKQIKKRSQRMVKLFNSIKGKRMGEFDLKMIPPFTKWLNGKMIKAERGYIELEFEVRHEMGNPTNLLHGGMQCGMMDDTIGMMTATLGYEGFLITLDFHVDYLGKVRIGESVKVIAEMVREGRNVVHTVVEIRNMEETLIAKGNANLLKTTYTPDYVKEVNQNNKDSINLT
ncbi:MAG: PaaI family thioesterase [Promethearchaeia archaeon]